MKNLSLPYYLIGITGGSASGKSLLLKKLREIFTEEEICIISQDDYYKPIEEQIKDEFGVYNFDLPESINSDQMYTDLLQLASGKEVTKTEYIFERKDRKPKIKKFIPAPVIIVEGIFVFAYPSIADMISLSVYIDCTPDIRYERRLKRDVVERGIPEEKVVHQWKYHVLPAYKMHVKPVKKKADIIINNLEDMEEGISLLCNHIRAELQSRKRSV